MRDAHTRVCQLPASHLVQMTATGVRSWRRLLEAASQTPDGHEAVGGTSGAWQRHRPWAYLGGEGRIALVDFAQTVQHLGELGGVDRLHSNLDNRCGVELQGPENLSLRSKRHRSENP